MKKSRNVMLAAMVLLASVFLFPIWNITLEAPQYPIPLGMNIYVYKFQDMHDHDIKNINLMNHYVGMKYIPETIPEFSIFPVVLAFLFVLGVILAFYGKKNGYLFWIILTVVLCGIGMYDFYHWEYDYGHTLDPKAILKFTNKDGTPMGFQPPLFGSKDILNFKAHSYPRIGILGIIYFAITGGHGW